LPIDEDTGQACSLCVAKLDQYDVPYVTFLPPRGLKPEDVA